MAKTKHYEVMLSFSYYATDPWDAVRQFIENILGNPWGWYFGVKECDSGKEFMVDSETGSVEGQPKGSMFGKEVKR